MKTKVLLKKKSFLNHYFDHIYVANLKFEVANKLIVTTHLNKFGIDFEIFEATNGYEGEAFSKFQEYQQRQLGDLKRYSEYSEKEKERGHAYIGSAGAMGYIYTYLRILEDAKKRGYKRFLILEDDILLSKNFESECKNFIEKIDEDWKILLLGASQYGWDSVDPNIAKKESFYFPRSIDTCGSFAIAFDSSIVDELIEAQSAFEAPFDFLPIGELYERYFGKCFVAYPNIVMPDVGESTIRGTRDQYTHSEKMKWSVENFDYPLLKPSISILLTSKNNLKYYSNFSYTKELSFNLRLFFNSSEGLRPLHNKELLDASYNKILPLDNDILIPKSNYLVTIDEQEILTENDIVKLIEYKINIREKNLTPLKEINGHQREIIKDRVSVIIPTYKRPENLYNALNSVIIQDYHDIEVIVVSDNGKNSKYSKETKEIINSLKYLNDNCKVMLVEHSVNRNGSAARNTGIMNSTGEYICFLDDDDIYLQGRLAKSIEKLKRSKKTVGAVYCGFVGWNSTGNDLNRYKSGNLTLEILLLDYKKHYLCSNTATYKREAVLNINGFDESYRRHQDLEFNLRFFKQYTIDVIKEVLVELRPVSTEINNLPYDLQMLKIKQKFLNDFAHIIEPYGNDIERQIYEKHWSEARRYISNLDGFLIKVNEDHKEGLFQTLKHKHYNDPNIVKDHKLIMSKISDLMKISAKKKPLRKISSYKSLMNTYQKIKSQKKVN